MAACEEHAERRRWSGASRGRHYAPLTLAYTFRFGAWVLDIGTTRAALDRRDDIRGVLPAAEALLRLRERGARVRAEVRVVKRSGSGRARPAACATLDGWTYWPEANRLTGERGFMVVAPRVRARTGQDRVEAATEAARRTQEENEQGRLETTARLRAARCFERAGQGRTPHGSDTPYRNPSAAHGAVTVEPSTAAAAV